MKIPFSYIFVFLFSLLSLSLYSQDTEENDDDDDTPNKHSLKEDGEKQYYVFSTRVSVTVPHPISNKAFRKCFVGVYEVTGGINIMLYKRLYIGASGSNGQLKITGNKIANYNASMEIDNAAGKIGCDFYVGDRNRIIFSPALSVGYNWTHYYSLVRKDPRDQHNIIPIPIENSKYTTTYYQPELDIYFLVDDNMGVGFTFTYSSYNHTFDPYELNLDEWAPFDKYPTGNTSYLSFGIGFYYSFLHKKK